MNESINKGAENSLLGIFGELVLLGGGWDLEQNNISQLENRTQFHNANEAISSTQMNLN
jgi:hypothetical protein